MLGQCHKHLHLLPSLWTITVEDALVQNVTSRTRSGKRVVSVPIIAGAYAGRLCRRKPGTPIGLVIKTA